MKKHIFLFLLLPTLFFSCKKEGSTTANPSGKKYKVSFKVTNFTDQKGSFSLNQHTGAVKNTTGRLTLNSLINVGDYLDVLYYYVFNSNGYVVSKIKQDSTMSGFGTLTDSLKAGHYTVIIAAGKKGLVPTVSNFANSYINYQGFNWQDTFYVNLQLDVSNGNIQQDVTLHRIVGKLELQLMDAIPSNAYCITLKVFPEYDRYSFNVPGAGTFRTDTIIETQILPLSAIGKPDYTLDRIIGNTFVNCKVVIICRDASGNIIAQATAPDVGMAANTKTILSGKLFGGGSNPNTQAFTVKVDTAWASTPNTVHF